MGSFPVTFKYFAYGSNMLTERLRAADRCPTASPVGFGSVRGYTLQFWKASKDESGKATIVRSERAGARVIGVVFEIDEREKQNLDRAEGVGNGYDALDDVAVRLQCGAEVLARTYIGTALDQTLRPYDWYRALVIAGAIQHGLPSSWIATLEATESIRDLDPRRRQRALDTLTKAGYPKLLAALPV
jgi:gamma-glutamylcyclotransferase